MDVSWNMPCPCLIMISCIFHEHDQALEDIGVRDAALRDNYHQIMKTPVDDWTPRNFLGQRYGSSLVCMIVYMAVCTPLPHRFDDIIDITWQVYSGNMPLCSKHGATFKARVVICA